MPQRTVASVLYITLLFTVLVLPQTAKAGFVLGDAANFAVLYEGNTGSSETLNFNSSTVTGNIGIGGTGKMAVSGPGTITGNIEFYAANTGEFSGSGVTITGTTTYNNSNVNGDLTGATGLNALSMALSTESGTGVTITNGASISSGSGILDGSGNRVFTATLNPFNAGDTFTINGASTDYVVINVPSTGGHGFNGSIVLAGGISSDHVLINLTKGTYATLSGGDTLTISTSGNTTTGIFLNPNGDIQINHSTLNGRLFGGDTQNMAIVSGANIVAPPSAVPEPTHTAFVFGLMMAIAVVAVRKKLIRF
jgi:hypothetical protein